MVPSTTKDMRSTSSSSDSPPQVTSIYSRKNLAARKNKGQLVGAEGAGRTSHMATMSMHSTCNTPTPTKKRRSGSLRVPLTPIFMYNNNNSNNNNSMNNIMIKKKQGKDGDGNGDGDGDVHNYKKSKKDGGKNYHRDELMEKQGTGDINEAGGDGNNANLNKRIKARRVLLMKENKPDASNAFRVTGETAATSTATAATGKRRTNHQDIQTQSQTQTATRRSFRNRKLIQSTDQKQSLQEELEQALGSESDRDSTTTTSVDNWHKDDRNPQKNKRALQKPSVGLTKNHASQNDERKMYTRQKDSKPPSAWDYVCEEFIAEQRMFWNQVDQQELIVESPRNPDEAD